MTTYQIKQNGKVIEEQATYRGAERAFWILTAHELKNGRMANYTLDLHSSESVCGPEDCRPPLPQDVLDVLKEHMEGE